MPLLCCEQQGAFRGLRPVKCKDISSRYQHCEIQSGGVHALDCFGHHRSRILKTCEWKSGTQSSNNSYTLVLQQQYKNFCKRYANTIEFSREVRVFGNYNMSVEVYENMEKPNCSKAVFSGLPGSILRCAPHGASFCRHSGKLMASVSWEQKDRAVVKNFSVRFKAVSNPRWSETLVQCPNGVKCIVENLNSSLDYQVQIQCVPNRDCSQCVSSQIYTVPAELTTQPVLVDVNDTDFTGRKGQRLLSLTWTFPATELYDGFNVMVWKTSGEAAREWMTTTRTEIRLILSYSAYRLNISAFNNASTSPAVGQTIPPWEDKTSVGKDKLNVTVHSSTSFTIYWADNLIENYICYSVEWMKKGHKAEHMSFYENEHNYKTLSHLPEALEPYKRYTITLHTRPNKVTCNMEHINNSESTYGSTQFYFLEGSPISAPRNITTLNVTLHSVVLQWAPIPEEDVRGFLLGYVIHFSENHQSETSTERNVTVDQMSNSCELENLESSTTYKVQISGFTKAGEGERSSEILFQTNFQDNSNVTGVITVMGVLVIVLIFGSRLIKRAKLSLWPSIPNPGKSEAMQKIEGPRELELLESIITLKLEEGDSSSLQILEKEEEIPSCSLPPMFPLLTSLEEEENDDEEGQPDMTCDWMQSAAEDPSGDTLPDISTETTELQSPSVAFASGYTTMEMFQQMMPPGVTANKSPPPTRKAEPEEEDLTVEDSRLNYVGQFSNCCSLGQ
ncbi:interleukin-31 receptor subunit alpha [Halichoeres trimaculatus]|uniref:interleukin-31 receptor subunit alpha n=1 Tax=Halichoeres trimaculatus TaxID=147232 RepID=UPI003D9F4A03